MARDLDPFKLSSPRIFLVRMSVFLILGIDPYPRKAGAVFEPVNAPPAPEDHPFAGLSALKEQKTNEKPAKPPQKRS